jgi:hypothetical protein
MNKSSGFNRALMRLGVAAAIGCLLTGPGLAGVQDSVFFVSPDGSNVAFDVRDVSRREVLQRLLSSKAIELEWVDQAFAEERISGAFNGNTDSVLQRLLTQTDFVAVYGRDGEKPRIVRLIIVGKAASAPKPVAPQGTIAPTPAVAPPPAAAAEASALKPPASGSITITQPSRAVPRIVPAPDAMAAPALIPPSAADVVHPLFVPPKAMIR